MIRTEKLSFTYRKKPAISQVTLEFTSPSITGMLGRNGSGKSTLGMLLAGLLKPDSGEVYYRGERVFESAAAMAAIAYVSEATVAFPDSPLTTTMHVWEQARETWDGEYAHELLELFELSPKASPLQLSRGQLAAFHATLGLAARTPVTILDEVHLGMDAVYREIFYRCLLADYTAHPRTIILSSHLIEEIQNLLDRAIFLDHGTVIADGDPDELRAKYGQNGKLASLTEVLMALTLSDSQKQSMGGDPQ
ncbi:ABC-2 type transport system ATP-binding protein [Actinobaculum suis]|uniref:ABC transporter ATP-binding protein n=1 Tax=Actinobaculum suis TaxID=1657 RepID=A0A0K9EVM7_9ACTO|nr:ABC transporter ATP-binding protein [Actinobaculum suis]KMY23966.1 hypothetical protein ACU19_01235 [Actinobaculum suis]MDY5153424.1 ABC transporter ATP-binding protein [Actinobaculum suis]OCA93391.1 hypothetical protein ACU20_00815 [Actinobaculum suis]OCA94312.1 hypothetical protein ACU21_00865 [Actinobaculum suis]SDE17723.1 ABC-2 type transport system ATP-binding protein [Actinobaculum suis]